MAMTRAQLRAQIQRNRRDPAALLHSITEYDDAINEAIRQIPEPLWRLNVDTSLTTVEDTRRYALAALTDITQPWQVCRVWVESSDDHYYQIGRWEVEDDLGTLYLVLDEDPSAADRTIKLEYWQAHATLASDTGALGTHTFDDDWIIYKATALLLMEADRDAEDAKAVQADLALFDGMRAQRERILLARRDRAATKTRTQVWD